LHRQRLRRSLVTINSSKASMKRPDTLREEIIASYVSSSAGIHRSCTSEDRRAFVSAYRWYLGGWLPSDVRSPWLDLGCGQGQLMSLAHAVGFQTVVGV